MEDGSEARKPGGVPAKRQVAKPAGGKSPKGGSKCRVQFHLGSQLIQRLGVHCAMTKSNQSAFVEKVLLSYLARYGAMRENFPPVRADYLAEDVGPDAG